MFEILCNNNEPVLAGGSVFTSLHNILTNSNLDNKPQTPFKSGNNTGVIFVAADQQLYSYNGSIVTKYVPGENGWEPPINATSDFDIDNPKTYLFRLRSTQNNEYCVIAGGTVDFCQVIDLAAKTIRTYPDSGILHSTMALIDDDLYMFGGINKATSLPNLNKVIKRKVHDVESPWTEHVSTSGNFYTVAPAVCPHLRFGDKHYFMGACTKPNSGVVDGYNGATHVFEFDPVTMRPKAVALSKTYQYSYVGTYAAMMPNGKIRYMANINGTDYIDPVTGQVTSGDSGYGVAHSCETNFYHDSGVMLIYNNAEHKITVRRHNVAV